MNRHQQEFAVMAVVIALLTIARGDDNKAMGVVALGCLAVMLIYGYRERR